MKKPARQKEKDLAGIYRGRNQPTVINIYIIVYDAHSKQACNYS